MRRNTSILILVAALVLILTPACAVGNLFVPNEPPPATATRTPLPTFTPTPPETPTPAIAPTNTPTPEPMATDTPVDTPTPDTPPTDAPTPTPEVARLVIDNPTLNVRGGPGTNYAIVGRANNGERYDVTGKNAQGSWYQIDFNGQTGWVSGDYVVLEGDPGSVQVAANIPAAPVQPTRPPAPTSAPVPTAAPVPTSPPAPPVQTYPWGNYVSGSAIGAPQCGDAHFQGQVQYANGTPQNGVCLLLDYYGPRTIKFSGGGGAGDGNWGFAPCGGGPCQGPFKIYVVQCPPDVPDSGLTLDGGGSYTQQSSAFEATITDKCVEGQWTNIIFKGNQ
ncbi:MAG: SH3 domain-containing protein [Anaerolineae bacterium]|nr:SH3 domain-containing protein [Anaerolineae bacterium]